MLPIPVISFINNATERNRIQNERASQEILNSDSNLDYPNFSIPTDLHHTYPNGIYDINNNVRIQRRSRGRPSSKTTKKSSRRIGHSLNQETVVDFINDLKYGASVASLCTKYGLSQSVGYKLKSDFLKHNEYPFRLSRGGPRKEKITSEDSEFFCELLRHNPQITAKDIREKLQEHNGKVVSVSAINKHLKYKMEKHGLPNFTVKKCVYIENRRNSPDILEKRIKYVNIYRECLRYGKDFVFIDETSFNTICFNNYGRSPVGIPCRMSKKFTKFSNLTAITAIHRTFGIIKAQFVKGPVNQQIFRIFLLELFNSMNFLKIRPIYVMDNVSFHKTNNITDLFAKTHNTCLLTVPWSCELNPIEYIFGIWKRRIKIPKDVELSEIPKVLEDGLKSITNEEVSKTIYFVETILFHHALKRDNLELQNYQHYFRTKYLNVGSNKKNVLNDDSDFSMEDLTRNEIINDDDETTLCSFTPNLPSNHQNEAIYIQNSDDSNSFLNSPILQDDSFDNSSECDQNSTINSDNEQILLANDCSSTIDLNEHNSSSLEDLMSDDSNNSFENSSSSTIVLTSNQEKTDVNLNKNNRQLFHGIETSSSFSSEDSSSQNSGDTVRLDN